MPSNTAAYVVTEPQKHIEVGEAPCTKPAPNQVVIRNHAVAINPIDWKLPFFGNFGWIKYPAILGSDSAGEVVEVGSRVTRFKPGDRVVGHALGYEEKINTPTQGSFQLYTILLEDLTSQIPDNVSYEDASVLPLGISTAAWALFQKGHLALPLPSINAKPIGKTVLIWGGSSSVGSNAIQLAVAAGCEVITTCSPHNFEYCKSLGAAQCFDYNSPTVREDIVNALSGKSFAGAVATGQGSVDPILDIVSHCEGNKFISVATYPELPTPPERFVLPQTIFHFLKFVVSTIIKARLRGISWDFVNAPAIVHDVVGKSIYTDFLGQALADGTYQCKPEPLVVGHGLEKLQEAFDVQKKGVSAKKVVLTL